MPGTRSGTAVRPAPWARHDRPSGRPFSPVELLFGYGDRPCVVGNIGAFDLVSPLVSENASGEEDYDLRVGVEVRIPLAVRLKHA